MAMIKCPECGKDISNQAKMCPQCGFPMKRTSTFLSEILNGNEVQPDDESETGETEEMEQSVIHSENKEESRKCLFLEKKWIISVGVILIILLLLIGIQNVACYWHYKVVLPQEEAYTDYLLELNSANDQICRYDDAIRDYNERIKDVEKMNKELEEAIERAEDLLASMDGLSNGDETLALIYAIKEARDVRVEISEPIELIRTFNPDRSLEKGKKEDVEEAIRELRQYAILCVNSEYTIRLMARELSEVDYSAYLERIEKLFKELEEADPE